MNYRNDFIMNFSNSTDAARAKVIIREALLNGNFDANYAGSPSARLVADLVQDGSTLRTSENNLSGYFVPEDMDDVAEAICLALSRNLKSDFTAEMNNLSDYSEGSVEAKFNDGCLTLDSEFWPCGYTEMLRCPECGEEIVALDDFDPSAVYVCPDCGEIIDLSKDYEDSKPIYQNKVFHIG